MGIPPEVRRRRTGHVARIRTVPLIAAPEPRSDVAGTKDDAPPIFFRDFSGGRRLPIIGPP